jgi:peroxiredoxin Q/BCP
VVASRRGSTLPAYVAISLAASIAAFAACGEPSGPPLAAGSPAPEVTFTLSDESRVPLASLRGSRVLVYFYPEDDTPGCTTQAVGIRDHFAELEAAGVRVFGVSTQDAASHREFSEKHSLPFPLVVDVDGVIAAAFEVPLFLHRAMRDSFLIAPDGTIERIWRDVSAESHLQEVLDAL